MIDPAGAARWTILTESVIGASHLRSDKPNQDAINSVQRTEGALPLLLAIADGHGGAAYFRSETGAKLAVNSALILGEEFLNTFSDEEVMNGPSLPRLRDLCGLIVKQWNEAVDQDLIAHPLEAADPLKKRNRPSLTNARIPYGSTLLLVIITEQTIIYLQLGDGDIMTVADEKVEATLPDVVHLLGNETQSLCMPGAWDDFVVRSVPLIGAVPSLILVATDGYRNSYRDDASFEKVAQDLALLLSTDEGEKNVRASLNTWLLETTQMGSGDDITVGLISTRAPPSIQHRPDCVRSGE